MFRYSAYSCASLTRPLIPPANASRLFPTMSASTIVVPPYTPRPKLSWAYPTCGRETYSGRSFPLYFSLVNDEGFGSASVALSRRAATERLAVSPEGMKAAFRGPSGPRYTDCRRWAATPSSRLTRAAPMLSDSARASAPMFACAPARRAPSASAAGASATTTGA